VRVCVCVCVCVRVCVCVCVRTCASRSKVLVNAGKDAGKSICVLTALGKDPLWAQIGKKENDTLLQKPPAQVNVCLYQKENRRA
jgi:hypothetical protein